MIRTVIVTLTLTVLIGGCAAPSSQTKGSRATVDHADTNAVSVYFLLAGLVSLLVDTDCEYPERGELTSLHTTGLPLIADGYMYTLYHEPCADRYWVHESGSIAGISRLLGPAESDHPVISKLLELLPPRGDVAPVIAPPRLG